MTRVYKLLNVNVGDPLYRRVGRRMRRGEKRKRKARWWKRVGDGKERKGGCANEEVQERRTEGKGGRGRGRETNGRENEFSLAVR